MQRVQVTREGLKSLSVGNIEYEVMEDDAIGSFVEAHESQLPQFAAHPHLFKIIGPEQVLGPRPGLEPPEPKGPVPKGLKGK
jgi:hypothetical protein